jgi:hypothetical protein
MPLVLQKVNKSKGSKQDLRKKGDRSFGGAGGLRFIPSNKDQVMETNAKGNLPAKSVLRGSNEVCQVDCNIHVEREERQVEQGNSCRHIPLTSYEAVGSVGQVNGPGEVVFIGEAGLGLDGVNEGEVGLGRSITNVNPPVAGVPVPNGPIIEALDQMISNSLGPQKDNTPVVFSELNSTPSREVDDELPGQIAPKHKQLKSRRLQPSLLPILVPRCLRFADAINNSIVQYKKRRSGGSLSESLETQAVDSKDVPKGSRAEENLVNTAVSPMAPVLTQQFHNAEGLELSVVLPLFNPVNSDSGVRLLLNEESLNDVEGFKATRDDPVVMGLEAAKLLENQQVFGMNFDNNEELPVDRMVTMEVRDRSKLTVDQESNGYQ